MSKDEIFPLYVFLLLAIENIYFKQQIYFNNLLHHLNYMEPNSNT